MRAKYKYKDKKEIAKLNEDSYEVLGFGKSNNELYPIIILNDELEFCNFSKDAIEIIDDSEIGYIQVNKLCYGAEFFLKTDLAKYCTEFESYSDLQIRHIWNKSKLINYFIESKYKIPFELRKTALNIEYKVNLIQGYILAVNNYVSIKFKHGGWELFYFRQLDELTEHIPERFRDDMEIKELNVKDYKKIVYDHLDKVIYLKKQGEKESIKMVKELYRLIDSIFINQIESIHQVITFYENEIIIKYESKFYSLSIEWGS